jgi:GH15 family glucan-1,4-alpha-glucosidase
VRGEEGTFSACSFWYVEALTRAGRLEEARQALTHLALISAVYNLDRALG